MRHRLAGTLTFATLCASLYAAPPQTESTPHSTGEVEMVFFDIGQGEATLITGPLGTTFLIDGGLEGKGNEILVPQLTAMGIIQLDYLSSTHYHTDHIGGLDELINGGIGVTTVLDRGDTHVPNGQPFLDYQAAAAPMRQTVPSGMVVDLGGGATITCHAVDGILSDGTVLDLSGSPQEENAASLVWVLEYGNFSMFIGGDLTGPSATSVDVEGPVADIIGDIDVLRVNGHGGNKSTSQGFIDTVQPEFAIITCGSPNGFNHPRQEIVDRLNMPERVIPVWCTSSGNGAFGYVDAGGNITVTTNGNEYSARTENGTSFTALCDEFPVIDPAPGEVVISEFHRDPDESEDYYGEWLEITSLRRYSLISLRGMRIANQVGENVTLGINICLKEGQTLTLGADGIPQRNGSYTPPIALPILSLHMADDVGHLRLMSRRGSELDRVDYDQSWSGGTGVSCERTDLFGGNGKDNFHSCFFSYGHGDRGTPGMRNSGDTTDWRPGGENWVKVMTKPKIGHDSELRFLMPAQDGNKYQACLSDGTSPGQMAGGVHLPINNDHTFRWSRHLPGWRALVPQQEWVDLSFSLPLDPNLVGRVIYASVVTFNDSVGLTSWARPVPLQVWH
jgi:beta-lactamase superfamily II metal-dependent hydrolase